MAKTFHVKRAEAPIRTGLFTLGVEKLMVAEIYLEDGAPNTALLRLREGIDLINRSINSVARGDDPARELQEALTALYEPDEAMEFMRSPNRLLNGRRPIDCGPGDVLQLLRQILEGAYT